MTRNELIGLLDRSAKKFGVPLKEFGMNRRILAFNSPMEWDIVQKGDKLEVTRRSTMSGAIDLDTEMMEPEYVVSVMRAIATGSATIEGSTDKVRG